MDIPCFINHSSHRWTFGLFYFDIMNNAAMKIHTYAFVWTYIFISQVYLRSGILCHIGNYMFNIMRHYQTLFQNDCTILQTIQQCMRVRFPTSLPILGIACIFDYSHAGGMKQYLFYTSLMTNS